MAGSIRSGGASSHDDHNEQGARVLAKSLQEYFPEGGVTFVMSVLRDKDYRAMIECVLPFARRVFVAAPPDNDRALSADELADAIREVQKEKGSALSLIHI